MSGIAGHLHLVGLWLRRIGTGLVVSGFALTGGLGVFFRQIVIFDLELAAQRHLTFDDRADLGIAGLLEHHFRNAQDGLPFFGLRGHGKVGDGQGIACVFHVTCRKLVAEALIIFLKIFPSLCRGDIGEKWRRAGNKGKGRGCKQSGHAGYLSKRIYLDVVWHSHATREREHSVITCIHEHGLAILTVDRPEKANSLTGAMLQDLIDHLTRLRESDCRALVLTGTGKVFSAGADLDEARAGLATSGLWDQLSSLMAAMPCLTIAALNGTLAGGAFGVVLGCDIRLAVPQAKFFYPVMKLGFLPQPADPPRLKALVGPARAKMILMGGQKIEASEAYAWGLIDRIEPAENLIEAARAVAADCLAASDQHVAAIKSMLD